MNEKVMKKVKDLFEKTIENGPYYTGKHDQIDYFALNCKGVAADSRIEIRKTSVVMFNYDFDGKDSILMLFSVPMTVDSGGHIAERIMNVVRLTEKCFIFCDYTHSYESKEDNFVYITVIKIIEDQE